MTGMAAPRRTPRAVRRALPQGAPRALTLPHAVRVRARPDGAPERVGGEGIELVRESWLVEDRWWTAQPLRRRYWEVVSVGGRNLVVFHDLQSGDWFSQAA
jgi:hypothetical protein